VRACECMCVCEYVSVCVIGGGIVYFSAYNVRECMCVCVCMGARAWVWGRMCDVGTCAGACGPRTGFKTVFCDR
jgi:hypothetical protein